MSRNQTVTHITLWCSRAVALLVALLLPTLPYILRWYTTLRYLTAAEYWAILVTFYCCAIVTALALWNMELLLRNILTGQVFTQRNVSHIRRIRWCCAAISLLCLPAAFIYLPLIFMVLIMGFLSRVITVLVRVMTAAVEIREENDLTI